jgi:hypothetical protein
MRDEEYLSTREISERTKYAPGSIRNLVSKRILVEGVHYVKPTPRKVLFLWSAMEAWLHGGTPPSCRVQRNRINVP